MSPLDRGGELVSSLGWTDLSILGLAMALLLVIAYVAGKKEQSTYDFFLGRRSVPALVVCLSFVATEISAVTIISVPATGFSENWQYLQFFIGSAAARLFVAFLFVPVFFKHDCTTIYEYLGARFGAATRYGGSVFFFITRLLASGVRLYAACMGVAIIMRWSLEQALILFTLVSIAFIAFGGIKAVVWTGAYEALMFFLAGGVVAVFLLLSISGGFPAIWRAAGEAGRLSLFNLTPTLADPKTLWAATLNAFFVGLAVFGTDQEMVQRLLTVGTRRASQKALVGTILAALPLTCLYLAIGTLLFVFYQQQPGLPLPAKADEILPHFVIHSLPAGLKGLFLAAIILASIDSPLSSLSSSFVTDIYRPLLRKAGSDKHYLWVSRMSVVAFGGVLALLAFACSYFTGILWLAFKVLAVTGGSTLGVFLLGVLTKRKANRANVIAMIASALAMALLLVLSETKIVAIGWSWLIVIGTATTFALAYALAPLLDR
ncbi:MAG: sodium/solute symporter [Planctomycetota bacterium]